MEQATVKGNKTRTNFEQHRRSAKGSNRRFYIAGAVILVAAVALVFVAMQGSTLYYISIAQLHTNQATVVNYATQDVRVAGKVVDGSIVHNGSQVSFTARDATDASQTLKVVYNNLPPDTFKDDADVVVTGTYQNGVFNATDMLAKCPSKYSSSADASN